MWAIAGIFVGILFYKLVIIPIERKKVREECVRKGLVPREML